jgi:hypothetical protein
LSLCLFLCIFLLLLSPFFPVVLSCVLSINFAALFVKFLIKCDSRLASDSIYPVLILNKLWTIRCFVFQ